MATRVSTLNPATPSDSDVFAVEGGNTALQLTLGNLKKYVSLAKGQIAVSASNGVTFYQCTADGSTNDQGTIETALFAARDNLPAFVEFGPGRYGIYKGTTLAITQGSGNLIIKGNNTRLVWSKNGIPDNQAYVALKIWPAVLPTVGDYANYLQNVTVDGVEFEDLYPVAHEGGTGEQTHGIQLKYVQNGVIENCLAYNIGDEGFDLAFVQNGKVINNTGIATPSPLLVGVANTGAATINLQNCKNVVVTNNTVQGSTVAGTKSALAGSSGIGLENVVTDPDDDISGVVISNNVVRDFADAGILVNNADSGTEVKDSVITSNVVDNCGQGVGFIGNNIHRNFIVQANVIKGVAEGIKFDLDKEKKFFKIIQKDFYGRSFFVNGSIKNIQIDFEGKKKLFNQKISNRYDHNTLTGCLSFIKIYFENTELNSINSICEDGINLINSKGKIKKIYSKNSLFDGVDFDFSNLSIEQINIENSLNDCIDFSSGTYIIENSILKKCGDKGISVGEDTIANFQKIDVTTSNIGLASKDSSKVFLENSKMWDVNNCYASYKKKQEFNGGQIKINNSSCKNFNTEIQVDNFSSISIIN